MIDLTGRVAIVTGAGGGLGRAHAQLLAKKGAKVVVNDLGGARDGRGGSLSAAQIVVDEIVATGGVAVANGANVTSPGEIEAMVAETVDRWGRVDILVNNAGILRDKTFAKISLDDFRAVVEVHLMGSVNCTKAVWEIMRAQKYGRIIMTTSSSGLFGNFGQSAYSAAKMALVGLMNTLDLEGAKHGIRVNCLSPSAATRMTEDVLADDYLDGLSPEAVSHGVLALAADDAPSRVILGAGAGTFERAYITLTRGRFVGADDDAADRLLSTFETISDRTDERLPENGPQQAEFELMTMRAAVSAPAYVGG